MEEREYAYMTISDLEIPMPKPEKERKAEVKVRRARAKGRTKDSHQQLGAQSRSRLDCRRVPDPIHLASGGHRVPATTGRTVPSATMLRVAGVRPLLRVHAPVRLLVVRGEKNANKLKLLLGPSTRLAQKRKLRLSRRPERRSDVGAFPPHVRLCRRRPV